MELHPAKRTIRFAGRSTKVPELTFRLLALLATRAPAIVPFAEIEAKVWASQVSRETLKQRAKLLRDALTAIGAPADAIEAVRNEGYRLNLPTMDPISTPARAVNPLIAAMLALGAIMLLPSLAGDRAVQPLSLVIESRSAAEPLRRALIRDLARIDTLAVIDAPAARGDLVVSINIESDASASFSMRDGRSGAVLLAEVYPAQEDGYGRAVSHFANYVHERTQALALSNSLPRDLLTLFAEAASMQRSGDEASLLLARAKLRSVLSRRPDFLVARALLARTEADLALRFGHPAPDAARDEAGRLVAAHPDVPEFRYALARTELAAGNLGAALDQMRVAARDLPFLRRDVQELERRIAETTT